MIKYKTFPFEIQKVQEDFLKRNLPFLKSLDSLGSACNIAISNTPSQSIESRLILYLARMVFEDDFGSILILCANGLSTGAMQILRGMFERTVTLSYLTKNQDQILLFWNYYWVDLHKIVEAIEREFPGRMVRETLEEIRVNYETVKKDYEITDCKKCGTKRININWSKKNMIDMAKVAGFHVSLIQEGYYRPMEETHAKVGAYLRRVPTIDSEGVSYNGGPKPEEDKDTLIMAHWLVLIALSIIRDAFSIEPLKGLIKKCENDFRLAWNLEDEKVS